MTRPKKGRTDTAGDVPGEDTALVVFTPSGRRGTFPIGTPIIDAARDLGVDIDSVCGGRGLCGRCQVTVCEGEHLKHGIVTRAAHLSPPNADEALYAEIHGLADGRRLGCAARIRGDILLDVPPESQVHRQVVRKRAEVRAIEVAPAVRLNYVEVSEPAPGRPADGCLSLKRALEVQWGTVVETVRPEIAGTIADILAAGGGKVTAAVRAGGELAGLWPGLCERLYGVAVDVGSTTIACHLCDLASGAVLASAGAMNPQIRHGEDLMSRISHVMADPGAVGEMAAAARRAINGLVLKTATEAGIASADIIETVLVGNPVMHHLVLGVSPAGLGQAPFELAVEGALTVPAGDLDLDLHPAADVYLPPCIAGYVGADTAAVILSEAPHEADPLTLIVDIGTNAEIVLGNRHRLLCASSPTGPAFEGAQISCGQRAAPGAVEHVRIDRETLEPRIKVIGCDLWSGEPGFAEAVAATGVCGICGSGIVDAVAEMYLSGIVTRAGAIDGAMAGKTARVRADGRVFLYRLWDGPPALDVTQGDVRAIQLAKAALYAGVRLLMDRMGIDRVERIAVAGAFGSQIDLKRAMVLGLIPDCDLAHVSAAGNAAGTGARIALLDHRARAEIERVVCRVEKVETATEAAFQDHFVAAMAIPHESHTFPNLARVVDLP